MSVLEITEKPKKIAEFIKDANPSQIVGHLYPVDIHPAVQELCVKLLAEKFKSTN